MLDIYKYPHRKRAKAPSAYYFAQNLHKQTYTHTHSCSGNMQQQQQRIQFCIEIFSYFFARKFWNTKTNSKTWKTFVNKMV